MQQQSAQEFCNMPCRRDVNVLLNHVFNSEKTNSTIYLRLEDLCPDLDLEPKYLQRMLLLLQNQLGLIKLEDYTFTSCRYEYIRGKRPDLTKNTSQIDKAIATHSSRYGGSYHLQLRGAGIEATGLDYLQVIARLRELADGGHIRLRPSDQMTPIRILRRPSPGCSAGSMETVGKLVFEDFQQAMEAWIQSKRQIVELFTKNRCVSVGIAEHLGTELPDGRTRCERCDWCRTGEPLVLQPGRHEEDIDPRKVRAVLEEIPDRDHPKFLARVAAGIYSRRVRSRNLKKSPVFRSMRHANFEVSLCSSHPISSDRCTGAELTSALSIGAGSRTSLREGMWSA